MKEWKTGVIKTGHTKSKIILMKVTIYSPLVDAEVKEELRRRWVMRL